MISSRYFRGFTLVELMITLAVVAIVVSIAAPSMGQFIRENRAATQANNFLASLQLARTEAIRRGVRVVMLRESDNESVWDEGWIVFTHWAEDNVFTFDRDEKNCSIQNQDCLLHVQPPLSGNITLRSGTRHADWIAFLPSGEMRSSGSLGGTLNNGTFFLCTSLNKELSTPRRIILNNTGRAYVSEGGDACS